MKKNFRILSKAKRSTLLVFLSSLLIVIPELVLASAEIDRKFALESVGYLRSWDNVDGLFEDYVESAYSDYFKNQSRFRVENLDKANEILKSSKIPYRKLIDDKAILGKIARKLRVESMIRTKVFKEGPQYRFVMEWMHSPKMTLMATHSFYFEEPAKGSVLGVEKLTGELQIALEELIQKVPFKGHVTGRDTEWVTVNIGRNDNVNTGDTLVVETLEEVKKHPLLDSIVAWNFVPVGRLMVESVEEKIAFCKVLEEEPGRRVSRFQKITKHIPKPIEKKIQETETKTPMKAPVDPTPRLGYIAAGGLIGGFGRTYNGASATKEGGGLLFGAAASGQLWITRKIILDAAIDYGSFSYSQSDVTSGASGGTSEGGTGGDYNRLQFSLGYRLFLTDNDFGPRGHVRAGYRAVNYGLAEQAAILAGPSSFTSVFVGVGADLPIRNIFGIMVGVDVGVFNSVSESGAFSSGTSSGAFDISFSLGGYYKFAPNIQIKVGIDGQVDTADFGTTVSFSHRVITGNALLLYYF